MSASLINTWVVWAWITTSYPTVFIEYPVGTPEPYRVAQLGLGQSGPDKNPYLLLGTQSELSLLPVAHSSSPSCYWQLCAQDSYPPDLFWPCLPIQHPQLHFTALEWWSLLICTTSYTPLTPPLLPSPWASVLPLIYCMRTPIHQCKEIMNWISIWAGYLISLWILLICSTSTPLLLSSPWSSVLLLILYCVRTLAHYCKQTMN